MDVRHKIRYFIEMLMRITEWFKTFFLALFVVELLVFIAVTKYIGLLWAFLLIIASSLLGIKILQGQFSSSIKTLRRDLESGYFASGFANASALTTVGGVLLVMPGLVTSMVGLLCLIPAFKKKIFQPPSDQAETIKVEDVDYSTTTYTKSSRIIEGEFVREENKDEK